MDAELRTRAENRLADAARALGLADPRPPYRERLRLLRQSHPEAFTGAIEHYEQRVLPDLAAQEPVPVWIEYGRYLGSLTGEGSVTRIDEEGRATTWTTTSPAGLVLFVPDDTASQVLTLCEPLAPSTAQAATIALLVDRKLSL